MTITDGRIDDFVSGDDLEVERTIELVPSGTLLETAWFMVKRRFDDDDSEALISKTITSTEVADVGWIEDTGADQTGLVRFYITKTETALLTPLSEYQYSIKLKLDNDKVNTPERGVMIAEPAVKQGIL